MNCGGIVLCGGQSRRMGLPKAALPFGAERMLPRVVRLLGLAVGEIVVVAAPDSTLLPSICKPWRGPVLLRRRMRWWISHDTAATAYSLR